MNEVEQSIEERTEEIARLNDQLATASSRDAKRIEKEIKKLEKQNKKAEFWGGLASKTEATGNKLKETGSAMQKAGLKTTAAVWTPAIYLGYKAVKGAKSKGSTPESDLIELVKECEQAHKQGKVDEATMKEYIQDFVNNHYRNE